MSRPTTKAELVAAANEQWNKLWKMIDSIPGGAESIAFNFGSDPKLKEAHWKRDKNMRDVLVHLYEWHELFLRWEAENMKGANNHFLPAPYTWRTYGDMNIEFWKKHQSTPYDEAVRLLNESHEKVMRIIDSHSNEELFTKFYPWTDGLGSYCVSVAPSHYDWAVKKVKQHVNRMKGKR